MPNFDWNVAQEKELKYWQGIHRGDGLWHSGFSKGGRLNTFDLGQYSAVVKILDRFEMPLNRYKKDDVVIEVGCGPGSGAIFVLSRGTKFAVDPLMDKYLEMYPDLEEDYGVTCIKDRIESGDLAQRFADQAAAVWLMNCIDHVEDPMLGVKNVAKMLRPPTEEKKGGELIIDVQVMQRATSLHPHSINVDFMDRIPEETGLREERRMVRVVTTPKKQYNRQISAVFRRV